MQVDLPWALEPQVAHLWVRPDLHGVVVHLPSLNLLQIWEETSRGVDELGDCLDLAEEADDVFTSWFIFDRWSGPTRARSSSPHNE